MLNTLLVYLSYPFVRYALIVGVLIALCSSLLGVTLVLKRFSFIGDGLSHVAFGAMAVASMLHLADKMIITLPVTILCAVFLLRTGKNRKMNGDAAVAMISVSSLAFGYLLMNLFSSSSNLSGDVCSTLFGSTSILTLSRSQVWLCTALSVVVVLFYLLFYNKIFSVTFDETFARATGEKVERYNALQKSQGYDLSKFAGKKVMRYVYKVGNYPGATEPVYATLLIYKNEIIGGDVTDSAPNGQIRGFKMPEKANKPTVPSTTPSVSATESSLPDTAR